MIHSLWMRLLLAFMLVLGVALGGMSFLASRSTTTEFHGFLERRTEVGFRRFLEGVSRYYTENQGWSGVQVFVERGAQLTGDHVLLADNSGTIVADSDGTMMGQPVGRLQRGASVVVKGTKVGTVYLNPGRDPGPPPGQAPGPAPEVSGAAFLTSVNRSILLSAAAAAVLALVLTVVLSRRILRPIEALTAAARAMERGDLAQRVPVKSSDEVRELAVAFNSMAASLARNEDLRKNMVTDVAHELRTPLSNIRGYLEAMRDGVLAPDAKTLDSAHEEAIHLSRLVDDLQELALAEAGQLRLDRSATDLADVADRAARALGPQASAKGIGLSAEIPEGLPPVDIDPGRIGQVLQNLLSNALAHTPGGGSVTVGARRAAGQLEVWVSDTGSGIPSEQLQSIFERFYRVDPSRARSTGGSGIGLAISRQMVEAHGGRIWAESDVGRGSVFRFTLPLAGSQGGDGRPSAARSRKPSGVRSV